MVRKHIFLPENWVDKIKVLSAELGLKEAEIIRAAILDYLERHGH